MDTTQGAGIDFSGLLGSMLHSLIEPITGKPGGYPDNMFLNLSEEEKENHVCNICFLIVKDPRQCPNHHIFCAACIFRWSMSGGETNSKCPVCRTDGRYKPHTEIEKSLLAKHVICPQTECSWAGKLCDYRWHSKSHSPPDEENVELPHISPRTGNIRYSNDEEFPSSNIRSRERLEHLMETFHQRLHQRREHIERHQRERERQRQESLQEVENLGRRLGDVSTNIVRLLDNMHSDSQRYQQYVSEAQDVLPPSYNPRNEEPPSSDEARVERILAGSVPSSNPFVIPLEFRNPPRGLNSVRPPLATINQQNTGARGHSRNPARTGRVTSRPAQLNTSTILRPNRSNQNGNHESPRSYRSRNRNSGS